MNARSTDADLIVEADGGSRGNPGPAAYGAVVRDAATGELLAEVGEAIGQATNNVAEYRGLIAGLEAAHEVRPDAAVDVRLDSKLVVEQMSGRWKIKNADLRPLAEQAGSILPRERVTYSWVPRAENTHADRLVNEALDGRVSPRPSATAFRAPMQGEPVVAYFVRHGQTEMTAERRFSGGAVAGPDLSADGRQEAERAAAWLANTGATTVVASPMVRTQQTAQAIAKRLGADVLEDEDWRECEFGGWEGLTFGEVREQYPDESALWFQSLDVTPPGGGESLATLGERVSLALDRLIKRFDGQAVVIATHSLVIRTLMRLTLDASPQAMWRVQPSPGSITELRFYPDGEAALMTFSHRP